MIHLSSPRISDSSSRPLDVRLAPQTFKAIERQYAEMTLIRGRYSMSDVHAEAGHLQVIFHDDDDTPMEFVVEVLHSVFKKPIADALKFTEAIDRNGRAMCGRTLQTRCLRLHDNTSVPQAIRS